MRAMSCAEVYLGVTLYQQPCKFDKGCDVAEKEERDPLVAAALAKKFEAEAAYFGAQTRRESARAREAELEVAQAEKEGRLRDALNAEHRVYDFTTEVDSSSAERAMATLSQWRRLDDKVPITIRFSSPGGSVISGLALFDYITDIRDSGIYVTTVVLGYAASMACILLQAGDRRVMGANAHILIHEVSSFQVGKLSELEDATKFSKHLNERLLDILATRSKASKALRPITRATIERRSKRRDWWLASEEAVRFGFADDIGLGSKNPAGRRKSTKSPSFE